MWPAKIVSRKEKIGVRRDLKHFARERLEMPGTTCTCPRRESCNASISSTWTKKQGQTTWCRERRPLQEISPGPSCRRRGRFSHETRPRYALRGSRRPIVWFSEPIRGEIVGVRCSPPVGRKGRSIRAPASTVASVFEWPRHRECRRELRSDNTSPAAPRAGTMIRV